MAGLVSSLTAIVTMIAVGFAVEWWLAARIAPQPGFRRTFADVTSKPLARSVPDRRASRLLVVGYTAAIGAAIAVRLLVPTYPLSYHSDAWILGACLLAILATILRGWALITLRQLFDRDAHILPDHQLLQHGPYRFIQHPAYAANILFATATGMALTTWPSTLTAAALALLAHLPRIHREEQLLHQQFPHTYPAYHHHTGRLIPHTLLPTTPDRDQ
jgi:protein-S-isoprenylcysteine O-methyltransferase